MSVEGKYKVIYLIDTLEVGGAEKSMIDIATNNKDFQTYFIVIYPGNKLASNLTANGIKVFNLSINKKYAFNEVVKKILPIIQEIKPDLIHSTLFRSDIVSRKLKKYVNVPLINSFVNNSYLVERYRKLSPVSQLKLFGVQWYDRITASKVDLFISNSETIKQSNAKALGINIDKIKVIYRGREAKKFESLFTNQVEQLRTQLKLADKEVLLNVSRLLDRKGQIDLIRAFSSVIKKRPQAILIIAGEGNFRPILEKAITDLNLEKKVLLLGNRGDIPLLLTLADVFVFPSHYEGLPGAIIEAMFAKKIIICSDIAENKECVNEDEAILFPKGNEKVLAEKILLVLNNIEQYKEKGNQAYKTACEKFDINSVVKQYAQTYMDLLNKYGK